MNERPLTKAQLTGRHNDTLVKIWLLEKKGLAPSEVDKLSRKFISFLMELDSVKEKKQEMIQGEKNTEWQRYRRN